MCTMVTVDTRSPELLAQIRADAKNNNDGWSVLVIDKHGKHSLVRTLSLALVLATVESVDFARIFVHSRFTTRGESTLQNTHGWESAGVFYFHNGTLSAPESKKYNVDSMLIGDWIKEHGFPGVFDELNKELFANALLVWPDTHRYWAFRSTAGTLFTDDVGNFSTNKFGAIDKPCAQGHYYPCALPHDTRPKRAAMASRFIHRIGGKQSKWPGPYYDIAQKKLVGPVPDAKNESEFDPDAWNEYYRARYGEGTKDS